MEIVNSDAKRRLRRAKDSERHLGRWLLVNDGPNATMKPGNGIVSETGRVGQITALQFDVISKHYAGENKNMRVPAGMWDFWVKIVSKAGEWSLSPLLVFDPTNEDVKYIHGQPVPPLHIITEKRHGELLEYERLYTSQMDKAPAIGYSKEAQLGKPKVSRSRR